MWSAEAGRPASIVSRPQTACLLLAEVAASDRRPRRVTSPSIRSAVPRASTPRNGGTTSNTPRRTPGSAQGDAASRHLRRRQPRTRGRSSGTTGRDERTSILSVRGEHRWRRGVEQRTKPVCPGSAMASDLSTTHAFPSASSTIVTGPSLTSSTSIRAPKAPVSTGTPIPRARRRSARRAARPLGPGRTREARTVPLLGIRDQSELAHDERRTSRVQERAVELPLFVLEDTQAGDAASESLGIGFVVLLGHPQQNDESRRYRTQLAPAGTHSRVRNPLNDGSQRSSTRAS